MLVAFLSYQVISLESFIMAIALNFSAHERAQHVHVAMVIVECRGMTRV